jgi:hypothetical protein
VVVPRMHQAPCIIVLCLCKKISTFSNIRVEQVLCTVGSPRESNQGTLQRQVMCAWNYYLCHDLCTFAVSSTIEGCFLYLIKAHIRYLYIFTKNITLSFMGPCKCKEMSYSLAVVTYQLSMKKRLIKSNPLYPF